MPGILEDAPVTDAERRRHDRENRPWLVAAVVAILCLHAYLLTPVGWVLGLPSPEALLASVGVSPDHVFDPSGLAEGRHPPVLYRLAPDREAADAVRDAFRMRWAAFYALAIGAFVSAYFLPLGLKRPALVGWSMLAVLLLYGPRGTAGLLAAHLAVYLTLHPGPRRVLPGVAVGGAWLAFNPDLVRPMVWVLLALLVAGAAWAYPWAARTWLIWPRSGKWLREIVVQSAILTVCLGALLQGWGAGTWRLPLGLLLFFWQWTRVILYHVDYKDRLVPENVSWLEYLGVFYTPGALPYWDWGVQIGQGYAYVDRNFLCHDKNVLVRSGIKMLLLALGYLVFWDWLREAMVDSLEAAGLEVYGGRTSRMVRDFVDGAHVTTLSVLVTTLVDLLRWLLIFGGMVHFKVGLWRVCGYRCHAYFDKPWLSTNLVTFWSRFTFHYRDFLVRAFYYPVFFRFFRRNRALRIVTATMAAAAAGNLIWGHIPEAMYDRGLEYDNFGYVLRSWPYFVLLGAGISLTQLYHLRFKRKRAAWTGGFRMVTDVLAAYATFQFYAIILIFRRAPESAPVWDQFRLVLLAFGIRI